MDINKVFENYLESCPDLEGMLGGSSSMFEIVSEHTGQNKHFKCEQSKVTVRVKDSDATSYKELLQELEVLFEDLYVKFVQSMNKNDQIRVVFQHADLFVPINFPFYRKADLSPQKMLDSFSSVLQSVQTLRLTKETQLFAHLITCRVPTGGSKRKAIEDFMSSKKSIRIVENDDNFCLLRAIIIGKLYADDYQTKNIMRKTNQVVQQLVDQMAYHLGLDPSVYQDISIIPWIEEYLGDYRVTVIDMESATFNRLYDGQVRTKFIYVAYDNSHFNVITSMSAFYGCSYYCDFCHKTYTKNGDHNCRFVCKSCKRLNCFKISKQLCRHCHQECRSSKCVSLHIDHFCKKLFQCQKCFRLKQPKRHVCSSEERWCSNCGKVVKLNHKCYIQNEKTEKEAKKFRGYIIFVYEAYNDSIQHVPNLVIAQKVCSGCLNEPLDDCENCVTRKFYDNKAFGDWLFKQKHHIAIAHNLKGYDGCFILQYILNSLTPECKLPEVLVNGTKILSITYKSVKLIDSYSFLPVALEKLPKMFDIAELKKGFFPHLFNQPENFSYVGPFPAREFYGYKNFSLLKLIEFDDWYFRQCDKEFNFKKELESYCLSDVRLLTAGVLAFRKTIMNMTKRDANDTGVDPWQTSITIASLCHYIFRRNMMIPNSIAVIPENGYNPSQNTSNKAILWLKYESERRNILIQHSKNGGEVRCGNYYLDGFSGDLIFEFHGCLFHGCPRCFKPETFTTC